MRTFWKTTTAALTVIALLAFAPLANADGVSGSEDNGDLRVTVGNLTGIFEGGEPQIKFLAPSTMGEVEYEVEFERVFEFVDSSGDGRFQSSEILTKADLENAIWTNAGFYDLTDGSGNKIGLGIDLTLDPNSLRIDRESGGEQVPAGGLSIVLKVKAFETPQTITLPDGRTFDVSGAEIKVDIVIQDWPFVDPNNSMLAIQVDLDSEVEQFEVDDDDGTISVDGSRAEGENTAEHSFDEDADDVEEEVRFSSGFLTTSSTVGFFRFVDSATVTDGSNVNTVPVTASFKVEMEDGETEFKLYLAYPSFTGTLEHDPSFGIMTGGVPTLFYIIGGAAVAGLVTVIAIRRRKPRINHESQTLTEAAPGTPASATLSSI